MSGGRGKGASIRIIYIQYLLQNIAETCLLLEFGGEDDHVHLMVAVHPKVAVSHLVSKLKGKSSYVLRRDFWENVRHKLWGSHFWSPSYCVVSCGGASLDVVKAYIEQQQAPPSEKSVKQSLALRKVN